MQLSWLGQICDLVRSLHFILEKQLCKSSVMSSWNICENLCQQLGKMTKFKMYSYMWIFFFFCHKLLNSCRNLCELIVNGSSTTMSQGISSYHTRLVLLQYSKFRNKRVNWLASWFLSRSQCVLTHWPLDLNEPLPGPMLTQIYRYITIRCWLDWICLTTFH